MKDKLKLQNAYNIIDLAEKDKNNKKKIYKNTLYKYVFVVKLSHNIYLKIVDFGINWLWVSICQG